MNAPPNGLDVLLDRNRAAAARGAHRGVPLMPRRRVFVVTCLDPRVEPAGFLGLEPGDAMVIRNAGGRVTPAVLADLAFIEALAARQAPAGPLFEIAVVHHTDCGTGALAHEQFRTTFARRIGADERALADEAVTEPASSVLVDVERVRTSAWLSSRVSVSGHVYDLDTGLVSTVAPAAACSVPVGTAS